MTEYHLSGEILDINHCFKAVLETYSWLTHQTEVPVAKLQEYLAQLFQAELTAREALRQNPDFDPSSLGFKDKAVYAADEIAARNELSREIAGANERINGARIMVALAADIDTQREVLSLKEQLSATPE